jgi:hypothetical protein
MIAGQMPPISTELSTSKPSPRAGSSHDRLITLAKNSSEQMIAITMRMFFDGIRAFASV